MKTKSGTTYCVRDIIALRLCYLAFRIAPKDIKPIYARAIFEIAETMVDIRE